MGSEHKPHPAPYTLVDRPCGCRLRVRLPGDGRLIPCWSGTFCAAHPRGWGQWGEIVKADGAALVEVPGMWWREARPAPAPPPMPVVPLRAPVMPLFMSLRGVR